MAANAALRALQISSRSASSAATRIPVAPPRLAERDDRVEARVALERGAVQLDDQRRARVAGSRRRSRARRRRSTAGP